MMSIEAIINRMMEMETKYYDIQEKYQELIHQFEELKKEQYVFDPLKERYEDECG